MVVYSVVLLFGFSLIDRESKGVSIVLLFYSLKTYQEIDTSTLDVSTNAVCKQFLNDGGGLCRNMICIGIMIACLEEY